LSTLLKDLARPAPIVLAPTGMVPTKAMTPHVPITPEEIARDVASAAAVGLTSVHLHARGEDGAPTWEREVYARIVGGVRELVPDLVINVSTSGRTWSELERRADVLALDDDLKPDMASLTLSSLNFLNGASVNAPEVIRGLAAIMRERGIVPELELFDFGMVNFAHVLRKEGLVPPGAVANLFFGNVAGMQATLPEVGLAVERLPADTLWAGAGLGDFQLTAQALAIAAGGGVRVGLEDGIWLDRERTTLATNTSLTERVHVLLELHGRRLMTPGELRAHLRADLEASS
jgi:3-keto-5-aminohexanoate cleavage enzyme